MAVELALALDAQLVLVEVDIAALQAEQFALAEADERGEQHGEPHPRPTIEPFTTA